MAQKGTDLDDVSTGGSGNRARIDDTITVFKFPQKTWVTMRFFGPLFTYGGYWVKTKKKDGKVSNFYTPCPSYNPENQQRDSEVYDPWRDLEAQQMDLKREERNLNFAKQGFTNAIYRKAQKQAPKKRAKPTKKETKTGFKEKDSDSYTPVVAVRLPFGAITKLKEQAGLNVHEIKGQSKQFPVTHPKYGCDVRVYYDPSKAPADQYQISIGASKSLTEEELAELKWDLSDLESAPDEKEVKRDFESWASRNGIKQKSKKSKSKKDEDEDDEDFEDDDGDDDEEDTKSSKSKKSKSKDKKKSKSKDDDDDEDDEEEDSDEDDDDFDDEEDLDDEDDEEESSKKSKSKDKKKSKKSKKDDDDDLDDDDFDDDSDDDDDEDDEEEDSDEEDDEKSSKKSKAKQKPAKSKKSKKKEEEDDDFDEDDEDDDSDDDLDDDDLDDDDDEEEEEEKPAKKSKSKDKKKSKPEVKSKKKKSKK